MRKRVKEDILRLRAEGKTYDEIRDALGCSKSTISHHCGEGQKEKTVQRTFESRKTIKHFIKWYKEDKGCADCGGKFDSHVLDFDHLYDKSFNLANFKTHTNSLERVKEEIAKCDVVCSNCHRVRTHKRRNGEEI